MGSAHPRDTLTLMLHMVKIQNMLIAHTHTHTHTHTHKSETVDCQHSEKRFKKKQKHEILKRTLFSRNVLFVKLQTLQKQTRIETLELIFLPVGRDSTSSEINSCVSVFVCFCNVQSLTERVFLKCLHLVLPN